MDEPTASLSGQEIENLFRHHERSQVKGISVVFISHRAEEVLEITDRVVVLRDGANAGETATSEASKRTLTSMMVGRVLENLYTERKKEPGKEVILEVVNVSGPPSSREVSFLLHRGEILGLAGLVGAGRTELARLLIGAENRTSGIIKMKGEKVRIDSPVDAVRHGIAYLPEDRKTLGLILGMTTRDNITMGIHRKIASAAGFIRRGREERVSDLFIDKLQIKVENREQRVENLSGGNQQKVVIGKWLATEPEVLILDEPTRGIDVGAKAEVHRIVSELADNGVGILLISSELPEILHLSDRILVMHEGRVTAELSREEATQELIMEAAVADAHASPGAST